MTDIDAIRDDLAKLDGKPPHNGPGNHCKGDRLYRAQERLHSYIAARTGAEAILKAIDFP